MPLFSVIIPTYNRADLLMKALESVFAQEFTDYEIIVVDDGSTDDTVTRLEPLANRLTLLQQQNRGPGAARNLGAKSATGEYLAFLDSDDLWFPWTLGVYANIIDDFRRPSLIAGSMKYFADEGELRDVTESLVKVKEYPDYLTAGVSGIYCGSGKMAVRRDAFQEVGGFIEDQVNAEDHDLVLRIGTKHGFVDIAEPILIGYRQHANTATRNFEKAYRGSRLLIDSERGSRYPGGVNRRRDRLRILTQHLRPATLDMLRWGERPKAWELYRDTFAWNLALGRFRFLVGCLLQFAGRSLRS